MFGDPFDAPSKQMSCLVIGSVLAPLQKAETPRSLFLAFQIEVQTTWSRMDHEAS
jgi:hypothetical protein